LKYHAKTVSPLKFKYLLLSIEAHEYECSASADRRTTKQAN
jgi:hypothetical protein